MATTPKYGLPSPEVTDPADGPTQIEALAQAVEDLLSTGTVDLTGGLLRVKAASGGTDALRRDQVQIGAAASVPASLPTGTIYLGY